MWQAMTTVASMDEKARFVGRIRRALGYPAEEVRTAEQCGRLFTQADDRQVLDRIRYRTHVEKQTLFGTLMDFAPELNLTVVAVRTLEQAADHIAGLVRGAEPEFSDTRQIIQHDDELIASLQLWKQFAGEPITVHTTYQADVAVREKTIASFVGITVPRWAIADSATLVQLTGPGRPRSTSLLPAIHIALLSIEHILADREEAYALLRQDPPEDSFIFISGPSKTADIEAHLVHGAHGPRELHLLVIDGMLPQEREYRGSGLFPG